MSHKAAADQLQEEDFDVLVQAVEELRRERQASQTAAEEHKEPTVSRPERRTLSPPRAASLLRAKAAVRPSSEEEDARKPALIDASDAADRNHDGIVTRSEFAGVVDQSVAHISSPRYQSLDGSTGHNSAEEWRPENCSRLTDSLKQPLTDGEHPLPSEAEVINQNPALDKQAETRLNLVGIYERVKADNEAQTNQNSDIVYRPGRYLLLRAVFITESAEVQSNDLDRLERDELLDVLEITCCDERVRGRIECPRHGWISLLDKVDNYRWAEFIGELPKAREEARVESHRHGMKFAWGIIGVCALGLLLLLLPPRPTPAAVTTTVLSQRILPATTAAPPAASLPQPRPTRVPGTTIAQPAEPHKPESTFSPPPTSVQTTLKPAEVSSSRAMQEEILKLRRQFREQEKRRHAAEDVLEGNKEAASRAEEEARRWRDELTQVRRTLEKARSNRGKSQSILDKRKELVRPENWFDELPFQELLACILGVLGSIAILSTSYVLKKLVAFGGYLTGSLLFSICISFAFASQGTLVEEARDFLAFRGNLLAYGLWLAVFVMGMVRWISGVEVLLYDIVEQVALEADGSVHVSSPSRLKGAGHGAIGVPLWAAVGPRV